MRSLMVVLLTELVQPALLIGIDTRSRIAAVSTPCIRSTLPASEDDGSR